MNASPEPGFTAESGQADSQHLAWDGFEFDVPADWNLSGYSHRSDASCLRLQDDYALRLEMEWRRSHQPIRMANVRNHYAQASEALVKEGAEVSVAADLPAGWSAYLYSMPAGPRLLTAFWLAPNERFFCFFKLHFEAASRREPLRMIRQIAASFRLVEDETIPWAVYDIAFRLNREFRLVNTSFQAGRKLLVFEWRLRRFYIWFFSLADLALKTQPLEAWCADFLNTFKGIRGVRFVPDNDGRIGVLSGWRHPLGHGEELARLCFQYQARCRSLPDKNQIVLYVYHFRRASDWERLKVDAHQIRPSATLPFYRTASTTDAGVAAVR